MTIDQMKEKTSIKDLDFKRAMPFKNRTIVRMISIASGTFMVTDMADAAIRSAIKSKGNGAAFASNMILRVNFVGIGRFALAIGTDTCMGISDAVRRNERLKLMTEEITLTGAKVYYRQAEMWCAAEATEEAMDEMCTVANKSVLFYIDSVSEMTGDMKIISDKMIEMSNNKELKDKYLRMLRR